MKQNPGSPRSLITVHEAVKLFGVGPNYFYTHKELPHYRVGRSLRFDADELRHWFKQQSHLGR